MSDLLNREPLNIQEAVIATRLLERELPSLAGVIQYYHFVGSSQSDSSLVSSNEILEANTCAEVSIEFVSNNLLALPKGEESREFLEKAIARKSNKESDRDFLLQIKIIKELIDGTLLYSAYSEIVVDLVQKVYLFGFERGDDISEVLDALIVEHRLLEKKAITAKNRQRTKQKKTDLKNNPKRGKKPVAKDKTITSSSADDVSSRLLELKKLFEKKLISKEIYEKKQQDIIDEL
jgi:hypothetical protein